MPPSKVEFNCCGSAVIEIFRLHINFFQVFYDRIYIIQSTNGVFRRGFDSENLQKGFSLCENHETQVVPSYGILNKFNKKEV